MPEPPTVVPTCHPVTISHGYGERLHHGVRLDGNDVIPSAFLSLPGIVSLSYEKLGGVALRERNIGSWPP